MIRKIKQLILNLSKQIEIETFVHSWIITHLKTANQVPLQNVLSKLVKVIFAKRNQQTKNVGDKMRFPCRLAQHALTMLARIFLENVIEPALVPNKYINCDVR